LISSVVICLTHLDVAPQVLLELNFRYAHTTAIGEDIVVFKYGMPVCTLKVFVIGETFNKFTYTISDDAIRSFTCF